jgi:hypothetical protein
LRLIVVAAVLLVLVGVSGLYAGSADAQTESAPSGLFNVVARADAISVEVHDGAVPLVPAGQPAAFGSPSSTQAVFDSLGNSTGFASAPYPGDFAVALPTTVNALSYGKAPPLPPYPFIVTSSYPRAPSAQQTNGPYGITSTSTATGTTADAHLGVIVGAPSVLSSQAASTAVQDAKTGAMVAQADTLVAAFSVGPLLTVGEVSAHAKLSASAGQTPVKTTSFNVGSMTIAGIKVGFTEKGLQAGPGTVPVDASSLTKVLAAGGVSIAYLPATQTPTSVDSAGLAVSITQDVPSQGKVTTTYVFGRVSAILEPGGVATTDEAGAPIAGDSSPLGPAVGSEGASTGALEQAGAAGGFDSGSVAAGPSLGGTRGATPGSGARATGSGLALPVLGHTSSGVYLALIGAGLALLIATGLVGGLGVRLLPSAAGAPGGGSVLRLPPR